MVAKQQPIGDFPSRLQPVGDIEGIASSLATVASEMLKTTLVNKSNKKEIRQYLPIQGGSGFYLISHS